jgi:hypothetical protein
MFALVVNWALRLGLSVVLVVVASACGGDDQPQERQSRPLPELRQELRPGEYRSEEFEPSLSFRVGKGWKTSPPEMSDLLLLTRGEGKGLGFVNAQEVYEPTETGLPIVVRAPEDVVGWFRRHPYLDTSEPEPITVGGIEGERFDVVVGDLPEGYQGLCGRDCVAALRFSDGSLLEHYRGDKARLMVLEEVDGQTVVMGFGGRAAEFDEFAPEAQEVIDTVEWRGSERPGSIHPRA